ncbi:hypothetical protein M0804_002757 [Polistes exclamans]|nr:hypothetical protein M0804_002757 [Polistes exclamans]
MRSRTCGQARVDLSVRNRETGGNTTLEAANAGGYSGGGGVGGVGVSGLLYFVRTDLSFLAADSGEWRCYGVSMRTFDRDDDDNDDEEDVGEKMVLIYSTVDTTSIVQ